MVSPAIGVVFVQESVDTASARWRSVVDPLTLTLAPEMGLVVLEHAAANRHRGPSVRCICEVAVLATPVP